MKPSDLMRRYESATAVLSGRRGDILTVFSTLRRYGLGPRSAKTDGSPRVTPIICDRHDIDLDDCRRRAERGDRAYEGCTGSPSPAPPDPTGDAAVSGDRFARLEDELIDIIEDIARKSQRLDVIVNAHIAVTQEQARDEGEPGCVWHQRAGTWVPVHVEAATVQGVPAPLALCSACYQHSRRVGRALSRREVEHHRTHGKWPREKDPKTGQESEPVYGPDRAA